MCPRASVIDSPFVPSSLTLLEPKSQRYFKIFAIFSLTKKLLRAKEPVMGRLSENYVPGSFGYWWWLSLREEVSPP
jgi:hypothetical protein